jgi:steroid delta-isomerase-like uncharacterized protein
MSVEQCKLIVRRAVEQIWNKGDLSTINTLYDSAYVFHDPAYPRVKSRSDFKQYIMAFRRAFPDLHMVIEGQIEEGDFVVSRWGARGAQRGDLFGIAPTGKQVMITGMTIDVLKEEHIMESRVNWDTLGLFQQLGIVPMLSQQGVPLEAGLLSGIGPETGFP